MESRSAWGRRSCSGSGSPRHVWGRRRGGRGFSRGLGLILGRVLSPLRRAISSLSCWTSSRRKASSSRRRRTRGVCSATGTWGTVILIPLFYGGRTPAHLANPGFLSNHPHSGNLTLVFSARSVKPNHPAVYGFHAFHILQGF